jgi:hypothetical protein
MKNKFKVQAIRRIAGIVALFAIIGFSMATCESNGDDGTTGGGSNSDPKTIKITDVPSSWAGTIGVNIFSEFKTSGVPDFVAGGVYNFSGGVINADLSPFTGSGEYYITIQVSDDTRQGYVYFGSGNSPVKRNITEALTTLSFNNFGQYNIWR